MTREWCLSAIWGHSPTSAVAVALATSRVRGPSGRERGARELGARADAEFGVDAREGVSDGLLAEEERGGDLFVGVTVGDELGDVAFSVGERVGSSASGGALARGGHSGAEPPQLSGRAVTKLERCAAAGVGGDPLQHRLGLLGVTGGRERAAGEQAGIGRVERRR